MIHYIINLIKKYSKPNYCNQISKLGQIIKIKKQMTQTSQNKKNIQLLYNWELVLFIVEKRNKN
jgi:hypothetical protein